MTGAGGHRELSWRLLGEPDLPALTELARECLSADGGQPFAASPGFLGRCYLSGAQTFAGFSGTRLACVSSLRLAPAVTTGLVAETEALGDGAHALYLSKGLSQVLAGDVMQVAALARPPPAHPPAGLTLAEWGQADPARFYAVYQAAFRDRPGFPGWTQARWVQWLTDDEDFRAEWTLLATLRGVDAGFTAAEAGGWITQMGVVPPARGRDIGARLIGEAVRRMRSAGETNITLNVNIDDPPAAALYRRLGFAWIGRRTRYRARP